MVNSIYSVITHRFHVTRCDCSIIILIIWRVMCAKFMHILWSFQITCVCVSSVRPVERFVTEYAVGMAACQKLSLNEAAQNSR